MNLAKACWALGVSRSTITDKTTPAAPNHLLKRRQPKRSRWPCSCLLLVGWRRLFCIHGFAPDDDGRFLLTVEGLEAHGFFSDDPA
ncbi:MAG: hypothetical protein QE570_09775 [Verrucomicrobiota bacterium]|nr:hypothetical protein [Verrucomicrobiota bacterium]